MKSETNTIPVNLQAAKMLWKSPWWAKAPEEERKIVTKAVEVMSWDVYIDYTKIPPQKPGTENNQVKDLRGMEISWENGQRGRIVGFADCKKKTVRNTATRGGHESRERSYYYWWVINDIGKMVRIMGPGQGKTPWKFLQVNELGMARRDGRPPEQDGFSPSPSLPCSRANMDAKNKSDNVRK